MRRNHIVSINILQPQSATNSKMCFSDKINFLVLLIGESKKLTSHLFYKSFLMNFQSQNWPPYCSRPTNKWVNGAGWLMTSSREPIRHYHIISEKAPTLLNYRIMTEGVLLYLFVFFCFVFLCFVLLCILFVCFFIFFNFYRTTRDTLLYLFIHLFFRLFINPFINSHMSPDTFEIHVGN